METKQNQSENKGSHEAREEVSRTGTPQHASADQGGTTDLDNDANSGPINMPERGSGVATKRNVTGSDYDGQVAT